MKKPSKKRTANEIDIYIGLKLRAARNAADLSQDKLADALGVSFQQVQKYERGTNRISCGALVLLAETLRMDVGWFFEGAPHMKTDGKTNTVVARFFAAHGAAELAETFVKLDPKKRMIVRDLAGAL
jgi:transcriptional regulator with XRE-family HTH domain